MPTSATPDFDAIVVGAGMAGLYQLHRLRQEGFSTLVIEAADDVGGTWYWNRYPGARCDIQSVDYSYTFDPAIRAEWTWSERYATQPEILRYLQFVADKLDLRKDIRFSTRVAWTKWDETAKLWRIRTTAGEEITARYYIMATGCLSMPKAPDIKGVERFVGDTYYTSRWPHEGVDFTGKRVAVIGTGSSGVQSIPLIAEQAEQLTIFQRTANFSLPAHNGPVRAEKIAELHDFEAYRTAARYSRAGVPTPDVMIRTFDASAADRQAAYDKAWELGELFPILGAFSDTLVTEEANDTACEYVRDKIRGIVRDPATAEALCPRDYPIGSKRLCLDSGYYETFNLPHVRLVDLRKTPIRAITERGIETTAESFEFDAIIYATGFDAMTGAIVAVDIIGRDGVSLKQRWAEGPETYLGLTAVGFPNLFMITGPGSPSVLSNMAVSIEQHVEWIADTLRDLRARGFDTIEPTETAEAGWRQHCIDCGDLTLFSKADSWYVGANVPGKPRVLTPYTGGVDHYRRYCDAVRAGDYLGFRLSGANGEHCVDGVVARIMPDVSRVLDFMETLALPRFETLPADAARAMSDAFATQRPPGPDVGEIVDGKFPGAAGPLNYRLYRPATPGPHPLVVYFHGGGWVLGHHTSDDPLCRDLCARSGCVIVSCDYRHAPEARFPAAADDAYAAAVWAAENATKLGGLPGAIIVAGWSAGANLAAGVAQQARDAGGHPAIAGQMLLTPVVDFDMGRGSYKENGEGYVLTAPLMQWFFDHYVDAKDRRDPRAAPLHGKLQTLPPAVIITCEFDPLRDEGAAYAKALAEAGNDVTHLPARGHTHTSLTMVDVVLTGAAVRAEMAQALRGLAARIPAQHVADVA